MDYSRYHARLFRCTRGACHTCGFVVESDGIVSRAAPLLGRIVGLRLTTAFTRLQQAGWRVAEIDEGVTENGGNREKDVQA